MQIGWIDYSREERNQIVSILRLLEGQTAMDELGIGTIRDAFSDMLFPGISTQQTRAKYFVLIPYLFALAQQRNFGSRREVLQYIHNCQDALVKTLVDNSQPGAQGIIGSRNYKQGKPVKTKPSDIYWSGLRTTGILRYPELSVSDTCEVVLANIRKRSEITVKIQGPEESSDDADVLHEGFALFSPLAADYDVMSEAVIDLTSKEADYLYERFVNSEGTRDSLTAFMLRNDYLPEYFDEIETRLLPEHLSGVVDLAQQFAEFIYGAHLLYNMIYAEGCHYSDQTTDAIYAVFEDYASKPPAVDLDAIIRMSRCPDSTARFLKGFEAAIHKGDIAQARQLVISREKQVKPSREKLNNPERYRYDRPIHLYKLDYRYATAKTIIDDILNGREG